MNSLADKANDISLSALGLSDNEATEKTTEEAREEAREEEKIDWSKPVVSRGFGLESTSNVFDSTKRALVAQYKSGQVFYFFGEYDKAVAKWLPLLEQNFAEAQASMGWLYQAGLGVKKDENKAFSLYSKAAEQNNAVAQNNLGVMYENGIAVHVDQKKAAIWYQRSAELGYRFGQYNYANSLLRESTLDNRPEKKRQEREEAKRLLQKSADQGVTQAAEKLKLLSQS